MGDYKRVIKFARKRKRKKPKQLLKRTELRAHHAMWLSDVMYSSSQGAVALANDLPCYLVEPHREAQIDYITGERRVSGEGMFCPKMMLK